MSTFAISDRILRDAPGLDVEAAHPDSAFALLPRLVGLGVTGLVAYSVVQTLLVHLAGPDLVPDASVLAVGARIGSAYLFGFFGAQVAGLPSAWFYALLAGIRTDAWRVTVEAMRAQATSAIVLLGLLPVYLAVGVGVTMVDEDALEFMVVACGGYSLPFFAGLWGTAAMYRSFRRLVERERARAEAPRTAMPSLLVLAWAMLFTAMAPLGVFAMMTGRVLG